MLIRCEKKFHFRAQLNRETPDTAVNFISARNLTFPQRRSRPLRPPPALHARYFLTICIGRPSPSLPPPPRAESSIRPTAVIFTFENSPKHLLKAKTIVFSCPCCHGPLLVLENSLYQFVKHSETRLLPVASGYVTASSCCMRQ
jgi:hypothetical protein